MQNANKARRPGIATALFHLAVAVTLCRGALLAYSSGAPPRCSGVPGDNPGSCTFCHRGLALNGGQGSVKIVLQGGDSYTPGVTQHIMVQVSDPQQRRWGFQMSARLKSDLANGQAGDFKPSDGFTQVICDSGALKPCCNDAMVQFIEHTLAGTRRGTPDGATFEFDWTPPSTDAGNVVLSTSPGCGRWSLATAIMEGMQIRYTSRPASPTGAAWRITGCWVQFRSRSSSRTFLSRASDGCIGGPLFPSKFQG